MEFYIISNVDVFDRFRIHNNNLVRDLIHECDQTIARPFRQKPVTFDEDNIINFNE